MAPQAAGKIHTDFEKGFLSARRLSLLKTLLPTKASKARKKPGNALKAKTVSLKMAIL
jgi:ribosome-binding ATPase YchF (GTP1/OBG family)